MIHEQMSHKLIQMIHEQMTLMRQLFLETQKHTTLSV